MSLFLHRERERETNGITSITTQNIAYSLRNCHPAIWNCHQWVPDRANKKMHRTLSGWSSRSISRLLPHTFLINISRVFDRQTQTNVLAERI